MGPNSKIPDNYLIPPGWRLIRDGEIFPADVHVMRGPLEDVGSNQLDDWSPTPTSVGHTRGRSYYLPRITRFDTYIADVFTKTDKKSDKIITPKSPLNIPGDDW